MSTTFNLADELEQIALRKPFMPGIIFPAGRKKGKGRFVQYSFQQLNQLVDQYAHGFSDYGIQRGERILIMLKPGVELIASVFALIKMGAVPILIDPGMGRKAFLQCISETKPTVMLGIPLAHLLRKLFPTYFSSVRKYITHGLAIFGGSSLRALKSDSPTPFSSEKTLLEEEAAVAFTSGGTGIPKGVVFQHGMFKSQIEAMKQDLHIEEGEVHLAAMYIFALFNPALGVTTVIPDMDPRRTEELNPARLVEAIQTFGVTMSLGSPTVWRILGDYCRGKQIILPSLKHIFMFGAPVYPELLGSFSKLLPQGSIHVPYGATEALPLTTINAVEILDDTASMTLSGAGVCVGRPVTGVDIIIIRITDAPIPAITPDTLCAQGEWGEITVRGRMVTHEYLNRPKETQKAKIRDGASPWHRMGDIGYMDEKGRVWICGRKAHRVETSEGLLMPICCEPIFNQHPLVFRSALVGIGEHGQQEPVLIIQPKKPLSNTEFLKLVKELKKFGDKTTHTKNITRFLQHPGFPVDVRHNAKIQRQILAAWAQKKVKK